MSKKYLAKAMEAVLKENLEDVTSFIKKYYEAKFRKILQADGDVISEGGMPAGVIKQKQKYAAMSDSELAHHIQKVHSEHGKGKSIEQTAREHAWRHGHGKLSPHYWNRIKPHVEKMNSEPTNESLDLKESRLISRDPFARSEVHRTAVAVGEHKSCDNCGQQRQTKKGKKYLYKYHSESDGGRKSEHRGHFCGKSCHDDYNS